MRVRAAYVASSVLSVMTACSLTTIPDLTSGNATKSSPEGGRPDAGEAGAAPFCANLASAPAFCDDFDGDPVLADRWNEVRAFDGTSGVELDTAISRSSPRSVVARVGPGAPDCAYATAVKEMNGSFQAVRLGFAVHVGRESDLPAPSVIGAVVIGGGNEQCVLYLSASATALFVAEQILHQSAPRQEESHQVRPLLPIGEWRRVEVDYDVGAKKLSVSFDGQVAYSGDTALACPYAPGKASAHVGLYCEPTGSALRRVHYDDVTIDVR